MTELASLTTPSAPRSPSTPRSPSAPSAHTAQPELRQLHSRVNGWYVVNARPLPWRRPDMTAWGVFLSEVMSHQTPVARVEPVWAAWLERWPTPRHLGAEPAGEAVRAWGRLGYPRRALRLHEAARAMVERHDGQVPGTAEELLALPGVGAYTAAAVACFAFGVPAAVLDTNVRRVLARTLQGQEYAASALTRAEVRLAEDAMPHDRLDAVAWNAAAMELGALVCTARAPRCGECPVADLCAWRLAGYPAHAGPARRGQAWHGTDRQARGRLLGVLREASGEVDAGALQDAWPDEQQRMRCLDSLVADGLIEPLAGERYRLPA